MYEILKIIINGVFMQSFNKNTNYSVKLCRYGGINKMIKQKGNYNYQGEYESKYDAPERKGFYAFIFPFIDYRLLVGRANGGKTRLNEVNNSRSMYKKFEAVGGNIWSHLKPVSDDKIIDHRGMWYKMTVIDLLDAIAEELHDYNDFTYNLIKSENELDNTGFTVKNSLQYVDKTDFEVFVCRDTIIS